MGFWFLLISLFSDYFYASCQVMKVIQKDLLITAELGSNVKILCNYSTDSMSQVSWYKQSIGERPLLVVDSLRLSKEVTFHNGFDKNNHYNVLIEDGSYSLKIVELENSDSATYYCAVTYMNIVTFGDGTVLVIKDSQGAQLFSHTLVHHPESKEVHLGDSEMLKCTVLTQKCAGEHSVYWFKQGSGESHPGIIYTHGDSRNQCNKSSVTGSPTQSCVYELFKRNLSLSDAGTYYCAVVMCGEILFGSGTNLFFKETNTWKLPALVLVTSNIITLTVLIMIIRMLQKYRQKGTTTSKTSDSSEQVKQMNQIDDKDSLNYAALSFSHKPASSKKARVKFSKDESVYAQVKL